MLLALDLRIASDQSQIALLSDIPNWYTYMPQTVRDNLLDLDLRVNNDQTQIALLSDIPDWYSYLSQPVRDMVVALASRVGNDQSQIALLTDIVGASGLSAAQLLKFQAFTGPMLELT